MASLKYDTAYREMLSMLKLVRRGIKSKHIADQSILRGEKVLALSDMIEDSIKLGDDAL